MKPHFNQSLRHIVARKQHFKVFTLFFHANCICLLVNIFQSKSEIMSSRHIQQQCCTFIVLRCLEHFFINCNNKNLHTKSPFTLSKQLQVTPINQSKKKECLLRSMQKTTYNQQVLESKLLIVVYSQLEEWRNCFQVTYLVWALSIDATTLQSYIYRFTVAKICVQHFFPQQ